MSTDSNAKIFSVIGGCRRTGRWIVPHKTAMLTLFGRAVIDLREAKASSEELEFTCMSVFANVTFLVPEGAEVRPSGMAIIGSSRSTVPTSAQPCDLPPISIDATTIIGRLRVRTTDHEPEGERKRRFWRRRAKNAGPDVEATAPPPTSTAIPEPEHQVETTAAATRPAATAEARVGADTSSRVSGGSGPRVEPFRPDQNQSPIHDVTVPASLEATDLDAAAPDSEEADESIDPDAETERSVEVADVS